MTQVMAREYTSSSSLIPPFTSLHSSELFHKRPCKRRQSKPATLNGETLLPNETFTLALKERTKGDKKTMKREGGGGTRFKFPLASVSRYCNLNVHSPRYHVTKVICHILWIIFCSVGLSYHLATICEGYFKYAVTTETVIQIPEEFTPPALSLCFTVVDITRVDLFNETSPCYAGSPGLNVYYISPSPPSSETCSSYLFTLPMDKLNQYTYNFEDLFDTVWYRDPDTLTLITVNSTQSMDEFTFYASKHVRSIFKNDLKCFTVNTTANFTRQYYTTLLVSDAETEGSVLSLGLKVDEKEQLTIPFAASHFGESNPPAIIHPSVLRVFTHSTQHEPRGYVVPPIVCNLTENSDVTIVYHLVKNILLPPPFRSACRDYKDSNGGDSFNDQLECIEICLDDSPGDGFLAKTTVKSIDSEKRVRPLSSPKIREDCVKKCPLPCERIHFMSRLAGWLGKPQGKDATVTLGSGEPNIVVTFKPRTEPFEFVIFVASCFNLWFGVSVYASTLDFCRKCEGIFLSYLARRMEQMNREKRHKCKASWWRAGRISIILARCKNLWEKRRATGPLIDTKRTLSGHSGQEQRTM